MLLKRYDEARLLCFAKGWSIDAIAAELARRPEFAQYELSASSLGRKAQGERLIPEPVAAFLEELEIQKDREGRDHLTEIVVTGLRVVHGESGKRDPREVAKALIANFPTDELAVKLADALSKQATEKGSPVVDLVRRATQLTKRLSLKASRKLATLQATLNHTDAKIDVVDTKLVQAKQEISQALSRLSLKSLALASGAGAAAGCLVIGLVLLAVARPHVTLVSWVLAGHMGEKADIWIPSEPLPGQKLAKDCRPTDGEEAISGGCWVKLAQRAPCGANFRYGDSCYAARPAEPKK